MDSKSIFTGVLKKDGRRTPPSHVTNTPNSYGMKRLFMKLVTIFRSLESSILLIPIPMKVKMGITRKELFGGKPFSLSSF